MPVLAQWRCTAEEEGSHQILPIAVIYPPCAIAPLFYFVSSFNCEIQKSMQMNSPEKVKLSHDKKQEW